MRVADAVLGALGPLDDGGVPAGGAVAAAVDAALAAGALQLESLEALASGDVSTKSSSRDLVSRVDVACERAIVERLRAACPGHEIEAEEETTDARGDAPRWFVDPLDGTVNYVHGIPCFCVSVGLYRGPTPLFGLVYAPRLGELFVGVRGKGAFAVRVDLSGDLQSAPRRLRVRPTEGLGEAVLATGFPYRRGELEHSNLENFQALFHDVRGMRRMGSAALDLAYVAAGRLDGFWELHLSPFDLAAGALLVREAGGLVSDADGGEDWLRGGHIVAAGTEALAGAIRARIRH